MAPPQNLQRRQALADGAIAVLARDGVHGLSHRAVDEEAGLPAGTTSNYFRSRDALLGAAAERVLELHRADMETAGSIPVGGLVELLTLSLRMSAELYRARYLAIYELTLEATRRPALQRTLDKIHAEAVDFTHAQHRALGLATSRADVDTLIVLFGGALYALVTGQATDAEALARTMVSGVLLDQPLE
ncbi:TetR/AcrR family transcriptional regulator [Nonomuraea sp. NPDC050556]|uniref:TetR/AcrR family transcriptional regulator n=1 Tax=Nonomuraea sp. NPDC050556 TaxID=3364369 RepID=UPI0037B70819